MSDTDTDDQAPAETFGSDPEGIRQAVESQRHAKAVAEVAEASRRPDEPDDEAPKVTDFEEKPLSVREASRVRGAWRADQDERAKMYRLGLGDARAQGDVGQAPHEINDQARQSGDPVAAERAQHEEYYRQEREAAQRIASMGSAEQQFAATEQHLVQTIQAGLADFNQRFADITTTDAALRLQAENPQRFQEYQNYWTALTNAEQQRQQVSQQREAMTQQRVAVGTQEFNRVAALHDQAFEAEHPELVRDPVKFRETQLAAQKYLLEKGLSKEELEHHWHGRASFSLREKISQDILLDAVRWRMAQDRFQQSRSNNKELMPVNRPGVARDRSESLHAEYERARARLDRTGSPRDAARELQAMRRLGARR